MVCYVFCLLVVGVIAQCTSFVPLSTGGGSFPGTFARIQHGFNVRPDLVAVDNPHPPSKYLGQFWCDSLVHSPEHLQSLIQLIGSGRVCLGSDYPFPLGEDPVGDVVDKSEFLTDAERGQILWRNGCQFLGIDPLKFAPPGWTAESLFLDDKCDHVASSASST